VGGISSLETKKQGETRVKNVHVHVQNVLVQVRFLRVFFPCFGLGRYPGDKFFTRGQAPQEPGDKFRTSLARFATRQLDGASGGTEVQHRPRHYHASSARRPLRSTVRAYPKVGKFRILPVVGRGTLACCLAFCAYLARH